MNGNRFLCLAAATFLLVSGVGAARAGNGIQLCDPPPCKDVVDYPGPGYQMTNKIGRAHV